MGLYRCKLALHGQLSGLYRMNLRSIHTEYRVL